MIIMDIRVDNLYAFKNFHMNMSYPKKIVDSTIPEEYLLERTNFRYKKVNIIMGSNATGKTTLGRLIMLFLNFFKDGDYSRFTKLVADKKKSSYLIVEFVTDDNYLYRFNLNIKGVENEIYKEGDITINVIRTYIGKNDNYERCVEKLNEGNCQNVAYSDVYPGGWCFSYPHEYGSKRVTPDNDENYKYILENLLKTLDPSINEVIKLQEIDNTYAIKYDSHSVIVKDGKITDGDILSSGTKAGIDIAYVIASLICDRHDFFYCDELFSYINSDIEKTCLSILIDHLTDKKQLFFTTHNVDILDMQLPKHSYSFLKKQVTDIDEPIKCVNAAHYLRRNTDSLKNAVENDLFCTAPDLERLYDIAQL